MKKVMGRVVFSSVVIFLLLFLSMAAYAAESAAEAGSTFDVSVKVDVNDIYPTQTAKFLITITNLGEDDDFSMSVATTPKWSVTIDPLSYLSGINVAANKSVTFPLFLQASGSGLSYGMQSFPVSFKSKNTDATEEVTVQLLLRNPTPPVTDYLPAVGYLVDVPSEIDPRQKTDLNVIVSNKNPLVLENVILTVKSSLFNGERTISLSSLESRKEVFALDYDPLTLPQKDVITVRAKVGDVEFSPVSKEVTISSIIEIKEEDTEDTSFFKTITRHKFVSVGNVEATKDVSIDTGLFSILFTNTEPKGKFIKSGDGFKLMWTITVKPGETQEVVVIKNYRTLLYVLILLVLGVLAYFFMRSPLIVRKETQVLQVEGDGISHIKILLHLKNRTNKPVDEVKLVDKVPVIASIDREFSVGTLHPEKVIRHEHKGILIKWTIASLEPYEERIITYNIISQLKIFGGLNLPHAIVKYKGRGLMHRKAFSNKVTAR